MRRRKETPKLVISIECLKREKDCVKQLADGRIRMYTESGDYRTTKVFDNRTQEEWSAERIKERGIIFFTTFDDIKETLNWNLCGDSSKYGFKWDKLFRTDKTGKKIYTGTAFVYE